MLITGTIIRRPKVLPSPLILGKGLNVLTPTPRSQIESIWIKSMKPMIENSTQILLKFLCNLQTKLIFLIERYYCTIISY